MRRADYQPGRVFIPVPRQDLKIGKASKINDFTKHKGAYYATFESALM
ncbi:MAG: hypothetical protein ACLRWF_10585 [Ruthenibacterium sp.]